MYRLNRRSPLKTLHAIQHWASYQFCADRLFEYMPFRDVYLILENKELVWYCFVPAGEWCHALLHLWNCWPLLASCWIQIVLLSRGWLPWACLALVCSLLLTPTMVLFYAQHVWDYDVKIEEAADDWGKHICQSCVSLWGTNLSLAMKLQPPFFGLGGAHSGFTYHLEHSLFPGVNYYHLSMLAPMVEKTALEYGITYPKMTSVAELKANRSESLMKYSSNVGARVK
jgi:hypothetical protein